MSFHKSFSIRTDMADEAHRLWQSSCGDKSKLPGVICNEHKIHGLALTETIILDEQGEKILSKARGKYYSIMLPKNFDRGSEHFTDVVLTLSEVIKMCFCSSASSVLVAALGNPDITPDALGNLAASNILVTAHLDKTEFPQFSPLSLCRPGVLGTSGIESALQIKAISDSINPGLIIVIDALAGSEPERVCQCIQISDAGISPGSGVGNNRREISYKSIGVPVISIGIPTVIDAGYFAGENFNGMFVTPRNIDSQVRNGARLIAYGINLAVHSGLTIEDVDSLIG